MLKMIYKLFSKKCILNAKIIVSEDGNEAVSEDNNKELLEMDKSEPNIII
jgi:hypothetical protein